MQPNHPEKLVERYGSPLFLLRENTLRRLYQKFHHAFSTKAFDTHTAFAYHSNYLPEVSRILKAEGAWISVVSGMEYHQVRALGFAGERIIFSGPYKSTADIEAAISDCALIIVDNFSELNAIERLAKTMNQPVSIGIRVNFKYRLTTWKKLGFNHEAGEVDAAMQHIAQSSHLQLVALHQHYGSFVKDPDVYAHAINVFIKIITQAKQLGLQPQIINLGGGFPSTTQLKPTLDFPEGFCFGEDNLLPFSKVILSALARMEGLFTQRPVLILEPGRAIVDEAMQLLSRVIAVKADEIPCVIIDAGINIFPMAHWYQYHPELITSHLDEGTQMEQIVRIYGPLSIEGDVICDFAKLPPLHPGMLLQFSKVGAYNLTMASPFIQPLPNVVMLTDDQVTLIHPSL